MVKHFMWRGRLLIFFVVAIILAAGLLPQPAYAHGFGNRYDLPVPLWLYIIGAGAAVALSFVVIGVFVRGTPDLHRWRVNALQWFPGRFLAHSWVLLTIKVLSVFVFVLVVAAGAFGSQNTGENLAPTMVWIIWWVGFAYLSALFGNIWSLVNPWKTLFGWAEGLYRRLNSGDVLSLYLPYPRWLGMWPGVALFLAFAWIELIYIGAADPGNLALLAFIYSLITWTGMLLFGKNVWLRYGEAFSIAFGILARFAPTEVRVTEPEVCEACSSACRDRAGDCMDCYECFEMAEDHERGLTLRPFGAGLLRDEEIQPSQMVFVLLILATVTFDGFTATPAWESVVDAVHPSFSWLGVQALTGIETLGLLLFPVIFLAVYLTFSSLIADVSGAPIQVGKLARAFVYSLVPIALAYHLAHYFSYLLIQGQLMIPLASDPMGLGWDLFGTADYKINIAIVNARIAWFTAVAAIIIGHIIAVYIAHVIALRQFGKGRAALRSQYPMLALMVGYTMVSLWILAQPIVETAPQG